MANLNDAKFRLVETANEYLVVDQNNVYWCRLDNRKIGAKKRCTQVCAGLLLLQKSMADMPEWEHITD